MADGCEHCEYGWVFVPEGYAERMFPRPETLDDPNLSEADRVRLESIWRGRLGGARNTVRPCRECCTSLYERWATGHLASKHDQAGCEECREAHRKPDDKAKEKRSRNVEADF